MKTYTHFLLFLLACCISCKTPYRAVSNAGYLYKVEGNAADTVSSIEKLLKPYRDSLDKSMNEVIGIAGADFIKQKPGGTLGTLVVDAMLEKAVSIDANTMNAISNYGGIRIPELRKGEIRVGKIFELLPFDNELVLIEVNKTTLLKWIGLMDKDGGWPVRKPLNLSVDGANLQYIGDTSMSENTAGELTLRYNRIYLHDDSLYVIATNDYVANGGDNCDFLKPCKRRNTGVLIRDLMLEYVMKHKNLYHTGYFTLQE